MDRRMITCPVDPPKTGGAGLIKPVAAASVPDKGRKPNRILERSVLLKKLNPPAVAEQVPKESRRKKSVLVNPASELRITALLI